MESYIGLVEVGVGLMPAGGGLKEIALRASRAAATRAAMSSRSSRPIVRNARDGQGLAQSRSRRKELGLLRAGDIIVFNADELLHVAKQQALAMAESG